jgi:hypothetical protein
MYAAAIHTFAFRSAPNVVEAVGANTEHGKAGFRARLFLGRGIGAFCSRRTPFFLQFNAGQPQVPVTDS